MLKNEPALRRFAVTLTGQRVDRAAASIRFKMEGARSFVLDYGFVARVTRVTRIFGSSKETR